MACPFRCNFEHLVPNSVPSTPFPCTIVERFQIFIIYIFASTNGSLKTGSVAWTANILQQNSMSWLSGLQILFSYRGTPVHKPEFWSSLLIWDNDIAVFDTETHLRQPCLSTHRLWLAPDTNASTGFHPDGSGWHSVISQLEEQYQLHQNWNSVSGLERFTAVNIQNWQYPNIRQRKMVTA